MADFMNSQPWPAKGPWFEGWYLRLTDHQQKISFAVIGTTAIHDERELPQGPRTLPGYQAFLLDLPQGKPVVCESFPASTTIVSLEDNFNWISQSGSHFEKNKVVQQFDDGTKIIVELGERLSWDKKDGGGPAGWLNYLNLPLQWYVHSLGSESAYEIQRPNQPTLKGKGFAHFEKNWGAVFPKAWIWVQGTSADNDFHISLAGGEVEIGPITQTAYMVGFKVGQESFDVKPSLTSSFKTEIDAQAGTFQLIASDISQKITIRARASKDSFGMLSIPTKNGYERNQAAESFQATVEVEVTNMIGTVVAQARFENAALEFGARFLKSN